MGTKKKEKIFEEEGILESSPGIYSKAYQIGEAEPQDVKGFPSKVITERLTELLNQIPEEMTMQFVVHNKSIPLADFLKKTVVKPDKGSFIDPWIDRYNRMVSDYSRLGHNNVRKNCYFILSVRAENPKQAAVLFRKADTHIRGLFFRVCRLKVRALSGKERLDIVQDILRPQGKEPETGHPAAAEKDFLVLNGNTFVRTFFIVSIPAHVTGNLLSDIVNSSSNMILSAIYEPVDTAYGLKTVRSLVGGNTSKEPKAKQERVKDRQDTVMEEESEDTYFEQTALHLLKEAVKKGERVLLSTFLITIFADDKEMLERDSRLLHIAASKYACQVKPLDLQQRQGLQTILPFAESHVDCKRALTTGRLAKMPPFSVQDAIQKDGLFYGLNSINNNLILFNRKNYKNLSGIIAGTEHSGKTCQCRREIFNALISTEDRIYVLSNTDAYDSFIETVGGKVYSSIPLNPFAVKKHYGLRHSDRYAKSLFLEALFEILTRPSEKIFAMSDLASVAEKERISDKRNEQISKEVAALFQDTDTLGISLWDGNYLLRYIEANSASYPTIAGCLPFLKRVLTGKQMPSEPAGRLQLYKYQNCAEAIVLMDHLFNEQLKDKADHKSTWLFIDSLDPIFAAEQGTAFLMDYVERMNILENVFTLVIQSSVRLFTDNAVSYRFCDFVNQMGYEKLLNQGAIERKKYTELLNIPHSLINYITGTEPGKGVICTPSSDIAFNDSFNREGSTELNELYTLFQI